MFHYHLVQIPLLSRDLSQKILLSIFFYFYGSMHHWSILIIVQRDATQSSLLIILQVHSTCFGQRGQASLATLEGGSCTVPEAVVTELCTTDDGYGWRLKHVEWICRIINRLLCAASRSTIINIYLINNLTPHCIKTTYSLSWKNTFVKETHFYESYTNKVTNIG